MVNLGGYPLIVVLSVIWGIAFVAIKRADVELGSNNLRMLRWFSRCGVLGHLFRAGQTQGQIRKEGLPETARRRAWDVATPLSNRFMCAAFGGSEDLGR